MLERIRRRLTLGYVGILALILVLFGVIVIVMFSRQLTREQDSRLTQEASDVADYVRRQDSGGAGASGEAPPTPGVSEEFLPMEGHGHGPPEEKIGIVVFVVPPEDSSGASDADIYGRVSASDSPSSDLGLPSEKAAQEAERHEGGMEFGPGGWRDGPEEARTIDGPEGDVRVVSLPVKSESGETIAVVQAAQSRWAVTEKVEDLLSILVPVGLGSLLLAGVGGLFMSRRAMQPVRDSFQRQRIFVADASHELKTPLALVKIGAEVIKRNPADPGNEEIVEDQLSEIDRMNALLSDLLLLARLDAGRLDVDEKPFDLSVVAAETAGRFLKRAASEGIHLEVGVPDRLPALGDSGRTAQILTALLDNAVRHTPKGGTVTISGRSLDSGVEASVWDTGPGISSEYLPRIFDRFYRAEEARTRVGGGTGLGLSIACDLAHAQGGELSVENTAGGEESGAVFRLRLPAQ